MPHQDQAALTLFSKAHLQTQVINAEQGAQPGTKQKQE